MEPASESPVKTVEALHISLTEQNFRDLVNGKVIKVINIYGIDIDLKLDGKKIGFDVMSRTVAIAAANVSG